MGADPWTFAGLAGIGDLVAAQSRKDHPSFKAGAALARGKRDRGPLPVAEALLRLAKKHDVDLKKG